MKFSCIDCGCDTLPDEMDYSVHDDVWIQASGLFPGGFFGFLCLQCLKTRLGRNLQLSDFILDFEVNSHITSKLLGEINVSKK